ncbi:hypothetical protein D3C86_2110350 [compost metagenome]
MIRLLQIRRDDRWVLDRVVGVLGDFGRGRRQLADEVDPCMEHEIDVVAILDQTGKRADFVDR